MLLLQKKGNSKDSTHEPKSKHTRYIEEEKERMIIEYRKKTKLGKTRLRYYIFQKEGIDIAESTIGKVIKKGIWWQKIYNLDRPHQRLGNLTPYEKLKSLGYVTGEEIAYRPTPKGEDLDQIFSIKEERRVQGNNTISYKGKLYQILPTKTRFGFAKVKVEIQKHLDKTIHIFCKGQELPFKPIIPVEHQQYAPFQKEALLVGV